MEINSSCGGVGLKDQSVFNNNDEAEKDLCASNVDNPSSHSGDMVESLNTILDRADRRKRYHDQEDLPVQDGQKIQTSNSRSNVKKETKKEISAKIRSPKYDKKQPLNNERSEQNSSVQKTQNQHTNNSTKSTKHTGSKKKKGEWCFVSSGITDFTKTAETPGDYSIKSTQVVVSVSSTQIIHEKNKKRSRDSDIKHDSPTTDISKRYFCSNLFFSIF